MNKKAVKIVIICVLIAAVLSGTIAGIVVVVKNNQKDKLVIYNWADYMDLTVLDEFCEYYKGKTGKDIEVVYSMFDTNETMITEITKGDSQIDLICPSEYAIQKLMSKNLLYELEMDAGEYEYINNVNQGIVEKVQSTFPADSNGDYMTDYFVPYMWGTLGILYNQYVVTEDDIATGWGILWNAADNPKLYGKILMKDSVRDIYVASVVYLKEQGRLDGTKYADLSIEELINTVDDTLLNMCEGILTEQRNSGCLKGYEVDFGKDDMIKQVAYVDLAWSGDALWAIEESWDDNLGEEGDYLLNYYAPDGNVWFDGWAIPKSAQNIGAAKEFINFMCRPDIAMRNMMEIGYTSAVDSDVFINGTGDESVAAIESLVENEYIYEIDEADKEDDGIYYNLDGVWYDMTEFFADERRYPEFGTEVTNLGVMKDFGDSNDAVVSMWERVKGGDEFPWGLIGTLLGTVGGMALLFGIIELVRKLKSRRVAVKNEND